MKWTAWSRRFLTAFALVGLVGFTFAEEVEVTWSGASGWATKDIPTKALKVDASGSTVELEQTTDCQQTLSSRTANVALVTNSSDTACEVFGVNNGENNHGNKDTTLARDVWLKVSGGKFSNVVGGSRNHWENGGYATPLAGDIFLELTGSSTTVSGDLIGAIDKGGRGVEKGGSDIGMTGNVLVVVSEGASVAGNILGGVATEHNATPFVNGNTKVRILSVLTGSNRVLGGSFWRKNAASSAPHTGNTAVEVELADTASGTFSKEIAGGSYGNYDTTYPRNYDLTITGNTSVSISAPNTVTFSSPIYGASIADSNYPTATVAKDADGNGGNSSVTIDGGTYTSGIYAAGYGSKATVAGKATLTLKAGDFSGATIGVGANGSTAGSSELVIAGTIDLSSTTLSGTFGALTLQGNLTLGTNRFSSATLTVDTSATRTITLKLTEAEKSGNLVTLGTATAIPENLTISATDSTDTPVEDWKLRVIGGKLVYVAPSSSHTWSTPGSGTAWTDGLPDFAEGDSVIFNSNSEQETVTLPEGGVRVETLTVKGNYAFEGTGGTLSAVNVSIEADGALAFNEASSTTSATTLSISKTLSVAGELSGTLAITATSATFASGSTLSGTPTITADTITFTEGSTIKVPASGVATLVGTLSGTATIDLSELSSTPALATPFPVLKAPTGLTLTPPEGYALADYAEGYYRMYRKVPTWTAGESDNSWSNLDRWTNLTTPSEVPTSGSVEVNFGSSTTATLTVDKNVALDTLLVRGSVAGTIEVGETSSLTADTLLAEAELTLSATATVTSASIATGKTLTLSGTGNLTTAFTTAGTLALAGGTFTLTDSASLDTLTAVAINSGATLDFAGKSRNSASFTLAGGTIKNSSGTAVVGPVTLTADSFVDTTGGEVQFNAANSSRKDLTLNSHKLTKKGSNLFQVCGADVDSGTIRIEKGEFRLAKANNTDSFPAGLTLSFAKDASYSTDDHWIQPSGSITLDADADAVIDFGDVCISKVHDKSFSLTKTGLGTIIVSCKNDNSFWSGGTTTVSGGTLALRTNGNVTMGGAVTIQKGAIFRKMGSNSLAISGALKNGTSGGGTIEVEAGAVTTSAANGNFSGSWKIAEGATLSSNTTNHIKFTNKGAMEVNGTLAFNGGTSKDSGTITGSGTLQIASGATYVCLSGFSFSGPSLACDGSITEEGGSYAAFTIAEGKTLSGTGTIAGAVTLSDGAKLDASTATANDCLSLTGTVTAGGNVEVTLPTSLTTGLKLLGWTSAPTGATYTVPASTTLDPLAFFHAKTEGLFYDVMSIDDGTAGSDTESLSGLSNAVKRALAEAAFAEGATSISTVTGTRGNEALSASAIDSALTCFALTPTVDVNGGVATISIAYDFGISGMSAVMEGDAPKATVKAKIESGTVAAYLADGAEIILQSKDKDAEDTEWVQVGDVTFEKVDDIYKATVSLSEVSNKVFRVLARTKTNP